MVDYLGAKTILITPSKLVRVVAGSYSKIQKLTIAHILGECPSGMPLKGIPEVIDKIAVTTKKINRKTWINHMCPIYKQFDGVLFEYTSGGPRKHGNAASGGLKWFRGVKKMPLEFVKDRAFHHQITALSEYLSKGKEGTSKDKLELLNKMRQSLLTGCPNGHLSDFTNYELED